MRTALVVAALGVGASPSSASGAAQQPGADATIVLVAPAAVCKEARLDNRTATQGPDGAFTFEGVAPGAHRLACNSPLDLYLTSGARLRVTLDEKSRPAFDGSGAEANRFLHSQRAMSDARFAGLWKATAAEFIRDWDAAHAADVKALHAVAGADAFFVQRETARLRFKYVWARAVYPFFHWRESDAAEVTPDPGLDALVAGLPLFDQRWWALREHQELISAMVHERARTQLKREPSLRTGDVRWLRAEFDAAAQLLTDPALLLQVSTRLLHSHVDDNGSRGIDPVVARWRAMNPAQASQDELQKLIDEDRGMRNGHAIAVYQTIEGVDLEVHVLEPFAGRPQQPGPAMLWFHGGSGDSGTWWHSPGVVSALRQNGVTVVGVEYRTGSRFDAGPLEQIVDASTAFAWVTQNAGRYGIDPKRIGVAGFSSGSTLALLLTTRGVREPMAAPAQPAARVYPAAVIVTGACPAPTGADEDGYFRKMVARHRPPSEYSPYALVAAGQPPALIVQAKEDEYCAYEGARLFVDRYLASGNSAELVTVEGAGHFFGFYYPPGQKQMRDAIAKVLSGWGWTTP